MTNQEILFRLFILEYMDYPTTKSVIEQFDIQDSWLNRCQNLFFERENEPESFEGCVAQKALDMMRENDHGVFGVYGNSILNPIKVKITILED
jgi:hypothetical protein